ncbi:MAG TPA: hypothetical protein VMJ72_00905 [Candidatus Paceibacterota bacterium]|nr:hypothetical protein [Candidatus Paceibacterota bacterium]
MPEPFAILAASRSAEPPRAGRPHLWPLIIAVLFLMIVAIIVLGPGPQSAPAPMPSDTATHEPRVYVVSYRFGVYSPTNLRIHAGDTVRFRNDGSVAVRVIADTGPGQSIPEFDSVGPIQPGSMFSYTFANIGTFGYHTSGRDSEIGTIIVR